MENEKTIEELKEVGAEYAFSNRYRHPSTIPFMMGGGGINKFDLTKVVEELNKLLEFVRLLGKEKKKILFVTSRNESRSILKDLAERLSMPYITGRWIGGTISNFDNIKNRISRLQTLRSEKESGAWTKFTKKENVLLNRELDKLETRFSGIVTLEGKPDALFVIDANRESIAVLEANRLGIPIIGLVNSDTDLSMIDYKIIANNTSRKSVQYFLNKIEEEYKKG